jgi:hypothetical protein
MAKFGGRTILGVLNKKEAKKVKKKKKKVFNTCC